MKKILEFIKKNKLLTLVLIAYIVVLIISPEKALSAVKGSTYYLKEMLIIMPVVFLLTVVIEALVPKKLIIQGLGEKSGITGNLLSLVFGSISAGPVYAAFPICISLLRKGASIKNIVIILGAWAVIKVPMLANEAKFLGVKFMVIRWVLTVISIFAMGYLMAIIIKKKDLPLEKEEDTDTILAINEDYCIGCGLCAEILPKVFEMKDNKAVVKAIPYGEEAEKQIAETVEKRPANAIMFTKVDN